MKTEIPAIFITFLLSLAKRRRKRKERKPHHPSVLRAFSSSPILSFSVAADFWSGRARARVWFSERCGMLGDLKNLLSTCFFAKASTAAADGGREGREGLLWFRDLGRYAAGDFSMAVIQANQVLEDQSQIESGQFGTFVGVYDGHGGPEAARYVCDNLFRNFRTGALKISMKMLVNTMRKFGGEFEGLKVGKPVRKQKCQCFFCGIPHRNGNDCSIKREVLACPSAMGYAKTILSQMPFFISADKSVTNVLILVLSVDFISPPSPSVHACFYLYFSGGQIAVSVTVETIRRAFRETEEGFAALVSEMWPTYPQIATVGSCCLVGVICQQTLYVANLGDSRVVLGRKIGNTGGIAAIQLSAEHNANFEAVRQELKELHPNDPQIVVLKHGVWRVKGIIQKASFMDENHMLMGHIKELFSPVIGSLKKPNTLPTHLENGWLTEGKLFHKLPLPFGMEKRSIICYTLLVSTYRLPSCMFENPEEVENITANNIEILVWCGEMNLYSGKGDVKEEKKSIGDVYMKHAQYNREPINAKFRLPEPMNMPILTANPAIVSHPLQRSDSFLIFASDGLWEHLSNEQAVEIVHNHPHTGSAKRLIKAALHEAARKREMRYSDLRKIDKKTMVFITEEYVIIPRTGREHGKSSSRPRGTNMYNGFSIFIRRYQPSTLLL
ncbi:hypothetical protein ACLOJK_026558 [Asimina triloba]